MRWFSLNREGQSQLNNEVTKRNVLDEVKRPQEEPREIQVVKSSHIHRDVSTYDYYTRPQFKRYEAIFNKCVLDPCTFESNPFGDGEWKENDEQTWPLTTISSLTLTILHSLTFFHGPAGGLFFFL